MRRARAGLGIGAIALLGCRAAPPPPAPAVEIPTLPEPVVSPWAGTLTEVYRELGAGRYAAADSILAAFATLHAGTPEGAESLFWRALLKVDPANPAATPAEARAALAAYVALEGGTRRLEVDILRRLVTLTDSLREAQLGLRTASEIRERAKDEEIEKLREELRKTQEELDRIKRRLGSPKP